MLGPVIHLKWRYLAGVLAIAIATFLVSPAAPQSTEPANAPAQQLELAVAVTMRAQGRGNEAARIHRMANRRRGGSSGAVAACEP
jgi:hypothetical protein